MGILLERKVWLTAAITLLVGCAGTVGVMQSLPASKAETWFVYAPMGERVDFPSVARISKMPRGTYVVHSEPSVGQKPVRGEITLAISPTPLPPGPVPPPQPPNPPTPPVPPIPQPNDLSAKLAPLFATCPDKPGMAKAITAVISASKTYSTPSEYVYGTAEQVGKLPNSKALFDWFNASVKPFFDAEAAAGRLTTTAHYAAYWKAMQEAAK